MEEKIIASLENFKEVLGKDFDTMSGNFKEKDFYELLDQKGFEKRIRHRVVLLSKLKNLAFFEGTSNYDLSQ
jgi:hypothetical protein